MSGVRAISYGGGVQSTAMLVLAAEGRIDYRTALFANVGDDSEHPDTLAYFRDVAMPFAASHGLELVEIRKVRRDGSIDSLMQRIERETSTIPIPMRMSQTGAPGTRKCTAEFKIRPIAKEMRRRGATRQNPGVLALGISLDEYQRMRTDSGFDYQVLDYPLIDLRLTRQDCINVIQRAGIPVPPKSSCYFCPFHSRRAWLELMRDRPDLFERSVAIERLLNGRREQLGKDPMWMTGALRPLDEAIVDDGQLEMFDTAPGCDIGGYCYA